MLLCTQLMIDCPRWPCTVVVSGQLRLARAAERYESVTSLRARYVRTLRQRFIRNGVDVPEDVMKRCAPSSPSQHVYALVFLSGFADATMSCTDQAAAGNSGFTNHCTGCSKAKCGREASQPRTETGIGRGGTSYGHAEEGSQREAVCTVTCLDALVWL